MKPSGAMATTDKPVRVLLIMPGNILIRGVNWIGDAVVTMPAIRALRKAIPDAKISLLVKPWVAPLFEKDPHIDEILLYDERFGRLSGKLRLSKMLRERGFSSAILFQNALDAAVIAYLARIPERIGYGRDGRCILLSKSVRYRGEDRTAHPIKYYLNLLEAAGFEAEYSEPWIYLSHEERLKAREMLRGFKRPVVGINPGAYGSGARRWPPERFAEVAARVAEELDGTAVLFGGDAESALIEEIAKIYSVFSLKKDRLVSFCGKTTLRELAALISECDVLLSNDSGPMHIGMAVKTPVVGLFGPVSPSLRIFGKGNVAISKPPVCGPCFQKECKENTVKCMLDITADEVFKTISDLIPQKRAVLFDRDGTLNVDTSYLSRWEDFKVYPEINSLNELKKRDFLLIGISNQSGIARGIIREEFVKEINAFFMEKYGFDGFYYCPHHPDEHCPCRKPEPEMALRARAEHGIDLKSSYVVGDNDKDMLLAEAVGAKGVLVLTGAHEESRAARYVAKDLRDAVNWILKDSGK